MTNAIKSIYTSLGNIGLYSLESGGLVDSELMAYDAAFAVIEDILSDIFSGVFVQTAKGKALEAHEKLVGLGQRDGVSIENRRELVKYRRSLDASDFTVSGMLRSMKAAGIDAELKENFTQESITVTSNKLIDVFEGMDEITARLSEMLPAHLEWGFDTGYLTWDAFDSANSDWNAWDKHDFTWDSFDIDGHNIFAP